MRSSNGVNLSSAAPTAITEPARRYASLTSALSRNVPFVDLQVAHEVALRVAHDLEVDARHGLVGEHEVVLGRLADADDVARDHELGAALRALDHDELAAAQVDGRRRRLAPDPRPRQVLHRVESYHARAVDASCGPSRAVRFESAAIAGELVLAARCRLCVDCARALRAAQPRCATSRTESRREAVGRAAAVVPRPDDRASSSARR